VDHKYPDLQEAHRLVSDMITGFRIGYQGSRSTFRDSPNLPIPPELEHHIDEDMDKETKAMRRAGPFELDAIPYKNLIVSPIGVVDKKNSSKKRVIHHLSWPRDGSNSSINNNMEEVETIIQSFEDAIELIISASAKGNTKLDINMSKIDIQAAYRIIPVHPDDWHLLGIKWRGKYYFEKVLVFGLTSSCYHWERVATTAHWLATNILFIKLLVHYIDDFLIISINHRIGKLQQDALLTLFKFLGLPISPEKLEGPVNRIIFLGIQIDTVNMTISLDEDRLKQITSSLSDWMNKSTASITQLQSITGLLSFAAKVIRAGRTFLRRIINYTSHLISKHKRHDQQFMLNHSVKQDLNWWLTYIRQWNGMKSIYPIDWTKSMDMKIFTDASKVGYGAIFNNEWFYGEWSEEDQLSAQRESRDSMPWKECKALVMAASTWGHLWKEKNLIFHIDCEPIVQATNKGDSREPGIMSLIRSLSFIAASHNFQYHITHIPGISNVAADFLSRLQVKEFQESFPNSNPLASTMLPIPAHNW
jgi:hypothetical protein